MALPPSAPQDCLWHKPIGDAFGLRTWGEITFGRWQSKGQGFQLGICLAAVHRWKVFLPGLKNRESKSGPRHQAQ
jgi:hypothetical protein